MEGTGDMPEAWGNANLVLLLRDMLVNEREGKVPVLAGLMSDWVLVGQAVSIENAPVTTGGTVSVRAEHVSAKLWRVTVDPKGKARDFVVHLPVALADVASVRVDGKAVDAAAELPVKAADKVTVVEVETR